SPWACSGRQGGKINRAEAVETLKNAFVQGDLSHVAIVDDFFIDREKPLLEFEVIGEEAILSPAVVELLAEIGNGGDAKKADGAEDNEGQLGTGNPRRADKRPAGLKHPAEEYRAPKREKQLQGQLDQ